MYTKNIEFKDKTTKQPWVNNDLKKLIDNRDRFYRLKCKNIDNQFYQRMFTLYKTKARNLRNYLKKNHIAQMIDKSLGCNRKLWKILNTVIFNTTKKKQ